MPFLWLHGESCSSPTEGGFVTCLTISVDVGTVDFFVKPTMRYCNVRISSFIFIIICFLTFESWFKGPWMRFAFAAHRSVWTLSWKSCTMYLHRYNLDARMLGWCFLHWWREEKQYLLSGRNVSHQKSLAAPTQRLPQEQNQWRASVGYKLSIRPAGAQIREYLHQQCHDNYLISLHYQRTQKPHSRRWIQSFREIYRPKYKYLAIRNGRLS